MRGNLLGPLALVAALTWTASGLAQTAPAGPGVAISELTGLSPAAVRARLASGAEAWPLQPAFQVAADGGALSFVALDDLMLDPVLAQRLAVFRTNGDPIPWAPYAVCKTSLMRDDRPADAGGSSVLMFRDGRLEAAFGPDETPAPAPPQALDPKTQKASIRRPRSSAFLARAGDLPLEDGAGFLGRWDRARLAASDRLGAACAPAAAPVIPARPKGRHELDASDMQGLALLPFAVTLPGKNRQREAARRDGWALLETLRVGGRLGMSPEAFAAAHKGVRVYRGKTADYAVASLDLGAATGRNLSNFNDAALVGLSGDRIAWTAPPSHFGPDPALLCLDDHGVPATPRPGCGGWGHFSP